MRAQTFIRQLAMVCASAVVVAAGLVVGDQVRPASAAGLVTYVGYADNLRANPANFPTPWQGSTNTVFIGNSTLWDAGAIRLVNLDSSAVAVDSVSVDLHHGSGGASGPTFNLWGSFTIPANGQAILTETVTFNFDTSDFPFQPCGVPASASDPRIPTVTVTISGSATTSSDTGHVLDTFGYDTACQGNESLQWSQIGSVSCPVSSLTLAPLSQSANVGSPATVTATFANSCGQPLSGVAVNFTVTGGPNAGRTGSGTTDANGQATFTYTSTVEGTDTLQASVSNPAGTVTSNTVTVTWTDALISAQGTTLVPAEGNGFSGMVASFTDPDTSSTAAEYRATIDWGDGSTSPGTISAGASSASGNTFQVTGAHLWAEEGPNTVTVTVSDVDNAGNSAVAATSADVADALLSSQCATVSPSLPNFNGPTATFMDASSTGTPSDFSATIDWGDGTTSAGTISGGPGNAPYTVSGSHPYASTGFFTVTTTVSDVGGSSTSVRCSVLVFAFAPGAGTFVIGDKASALGNSVEFWGAQWWKFNPTSGSSVAASFKGFAEALSPPSCGGVWTADPGSSTPPPSGPLPAFMGVVVTSSYQQTGSTISGNAPHIVIVKTNPGYQPDAGSPGTGTVVSDVC